MKLQFAFGMLVFFLMRPIWSATLEINPISLSFFEGHEVETLEITNHENVPVVLQLDIKSWKQNHEGKDRYEATSNLLASPPLFTLAGNQSQIVRIALLKPYNKSVEESYRLIIREVISNAEKGKDKNLRIALKMLLPMFVGFSSEWKPESDWKIESVSKEKSKILIKNNGRQHILVNEVAFFDAQNKIIAKSGPLFGYVLPGSTHSFLVDMPNGLNKKDIAFLKINA